MYTKCTYVQKMYTKCTKMYNVQKMYKNAQGGEETLSFHENKTLAPSEQLKNKR